MARFPTTAMRRFGSFLALYCILRSKVLPKVSQPAHWLFSCLSVICFYELRAAKARGW